MTGIDPTTPLAKELFEKANDILGFRITDIMFEGTADELKQTKVTQPIVFRSAGDKIPTLNNVSSEQVNLLMAELFTNLQHGVGATVISSASGQEVAMEGDEWRNGLFSYVLMNAFNDKSADTDGDGLLNVTELQAYCQQRVLSLSQGRQRPTLRSENYQQNFNIGKNR